MGIVNYNGVSTKDLDLIVQFIPTYNFPEKDISVEHVSGRNGDILLNNNCYRNVTVTYYLAKVFRSGEKFVNSANKIAEWLHSSEGYAKLEDSYEPDYYRMAIFKNNGELSNYYDVATTIEVQFECKPQKWLKVGDEPVDISSTAKTLRNPTNYNSRPIFEFDVAANTTVTITVGTNTMTLLPLTANTHVIVDCENMECYSATANLNKYLRLDSNDFPTLGKKTDTSVSILNASNATIKPRWWTL